MMPRKRKSHHHFIPEDILHEKQSLQLCAVHAVNNLLQIGERIQDCSFVFFSNGEMYKHEDSKKFEQRATKKEFDEIADLLQQQEKEILLQDSTWVRWWTTTNFLGMNSNHHRSLVTGNYSFEVIEVALQRRGVKLERCYHRNIGYAFDCQEEGELIIGFIIHSLASTRTEVSLRSFIGQIFSTGHHWYAISRLRRGIVKYTLEKNNSESLESKTEMELDDKYTSKCWYIIDSCLDDVTEIQTDKKLLCILEEVRSKGGDIFRAITRLDLVLYE